MRLFSVTIALCAITAFAADPVAAPETVKPVVVPEKKAATDIQKPVTPPATDAEKKVATPATDAQKKAAADTQKAVTPPAEKKAGTDAQKPATDAEKNAAADAQKPAMETEKKVEPVIVPEHPLADTSHSAEERARLQPDDSDAALDKALGLDKKPEDDAAAEPDALGFQLIKTLFTLALVVGLIYLSLNYGLRKLMGIKGAPLGGKGGVVSVLERIPLEQRRTLFVLKAAGEYLLVGTSEGGMTLISKLDSAEVERIQRERGAAQVQLSPFFQKLLSGQKKSGPPPQA